MSQGSIAQVAALVGDSARATMLAALMDGRALTAGELAFLARVSWDPLESTCRHASLSIL